MSISNLQGEILCKEGLDNNALSDVLSTIYGDYDVLGTKILDQNMTTLIIELEQKVVLAIPLYNYILFMISDQYSNIGKMNVYCNTICNNLKGIFVNEDKKWIVFICLIIYLLILYIVKYVSCYVFIHIL